MTAVPAKSPTAATPECPQHGPMTQRPDAQTPEQRFTGTWFTCTAPSCWNAVLYPSDALVADLEAQARAPKGTITITHTRADGTLVEGSRKGDGVYELLRPCGFRYFPSLGQLGIPRSRDNAAQRWRIDAAATALREAGWTVVIDIDEDARRTFAEAEQERYERANDRAARYAGHAGNAAARSAAAHARGHQIADVIPPGQPILVGHHSEPRARRDQERIHHAARTSVEESRKAEYWAGRARAAASYENLRKSVPVTLRRIDKLEAELRRVQRWLRGESAGGYTRSDTDELNRRKAEIEEELAHWRQHIADAERRGYKVWGPADFTKGDFVNCGGTWYQVQRVNKKTLTIPHIHDGVGVPVLRKDPKGAGRGSYTIPYDVVRGWASAEDIARLEATTPEPESERTVCPHCVRVAKGQKRFSPARGMCTVCGYAEPRNFKSQPAPAPAPEATEPQEQTEQGSAAETCPMCHSDQWNAQERHCPHCHHDPKTKPTTAPAPADGARDGQESQALVFIVSRNTKRTRARALWAMSRREAQAVCSDPRTAGRSFMLCWTQSPGEEGADWEWITDRGTFAPVLEELGITPRRVWAAVPEAAAGA
ncbi:DUF3560 domain-containing protein [Streptomyces rubradiris]|uniref:DUF3560 domain-containing protein n=1 Tax=Streptomyces rubradiris TaxID=285531 RepID=UPI001E449B66|nr:DUF3560 domain-containing protein [Streptomyces rubradiris]